MRKLRAKVRDIKDFATEGSPLQRHLHAADGPARAAAIEHLAAKYRKGSVDVVVGERGREQRGLYRLHAKVYGQRGVKGGSVDVESPALLIDAIERGPALGVPRVRQANPAILKQRSAPGGRSIHETACHLAEVRPLFFRRRSCPGCVV